MTQRCPYEIQRNLGKNQFQGSFTKGFRDENSKTEEL